MKTVALILAAGTGQRLDGPRAKQFLPLGGISILRHSILAFAHHPAVDAVFVVGNDEDAAAYTTALAGLVDAPLIPGGVNRQASALAGLEALSGQEIDRVLIHDAARPFVSRMQIDDLLAALGDNVCAILAETVTDTIKRVGENGLIEDSLTREGLFAAQTPQGFSFATILDAHRRMAGGENTDDAAIARAAGLDVKIVASSPANFKITTAQDLERARAVIEAGLPDLRIGQGFDVHRLGPGDGVQLCGVLIPHDGALIGHSDADVALHAITDALLGSIAAGDIGKHFPPSEERWRDAASATFVSHALDLLCERGGILCHLDLTIICEAPKVEPHRESLRQALADLLSLEADRVSVKATTTERLGTTGDGSGIAAQATATVRLPESPPDD